MALPILAIFYKNQLKHLWIAYAILIAGIGAGITSMVQVFGLGFDKPFPKIMHIQAGDIAMSLAMFSFCTLFYFYTQKHRIAMYLSLIAALFALIASFLTTARGHGLVYHSYYSLSFGLTVNHYQNGLSQAYY
ncbi:O-antigen polymerase [Actinobacillus equuli]|nr:O-antigen polymerase [Actinobacillus equuli]